MAKVRTSLGTRFGLLFINRHREDMLSIIRAINNIDRELRPIILWLNFNGYATSSCCAGHRLGAAYKGKGKSYDVEGYITFSKTSKLMKLMKFLEFFGKNGFKIESREGTSPIARIVFISVKNGKLLHHYKSQNKLDITQREINIFWKNIFEQMWFGKK